MVEGQRWRERPGGRRAALPRRGAACDCKPASWRHHPSLPHAQIDSGSDTSATVMPGLRLPRISLLAGAPRMRGTFLSMYASHASASGVSCGGGAGAGAGAGDGRAEVSARWGCRASSQACNSRAASRRLKRATGTRPPWAVQRRAPGRRTPRAGCARPGPPRHCAALPRPPKWAPRFAHLLHQRAHVGDALQVVLKVRLERRRALVLLVVVAALHVHLGRLLSRRLRRGDGGGRRQRVLPRERHVGSQHRGRTELHREED